MTVVTFKSFCSQFKPVCFFLGERLRDISVYLGDDYVNGPFPVTCGNFDGPGENAEVVHIVCDKPAHGRFVRIQMNNFQQDNFLTLCEVRVLV